MPIARRLGERVIGNCAEKIKPYLMQEVKSLSIALDDYSKIVASTCQESMDDAQENENLNGSGQQSVCHLLISIFTIRLLKGIIWGVYYRIPC